MKVIKFTSDENRCHAFGHKDVRRCRLERLPGEKTCSIHKNYYKDWLQRSGRADWHLLTKRQQNEFIYQIQNRLIDIPIDYIRTLNTFDTEYFALLMKYTDYSPIVNRACLESCVRKYLFCHCEFPLTDNDREEFCNSLEPFTKDVESTVFAISVISNYMIEKCIHSQIHITNFRDAVLASYNPRMIPRISRPYFRCLLFCSNLKDYLVTNKIKQRVQAIAPEFIEFYNESYLDDKVNPVNKLVESFNTIHSAEIRRRCAVYKEELMKKAWHPSRIEKLLEMGYDACGDDY